MANRMKEKGCSRKTPVLTLLSEAGHLKITIAINEDKCPIFYDHFSVSKMSVFTKHPLNMGGGDYTFQRRLIEVSGANQSFFANKFIQSMVEGHLLRYHAFSMSTIQLESLLRCGSQSFSNIKSFLLTHPQAKTAKEMQYQRMQELKSAKGTYKQAN